MSAYAFKEEPADELHDSHQDEEARLVKQRAVPAPTKESALASNLRAIVRDVPRAGRSIGLLPFLVYAVRRRTRIHVVLGTRSVDVVAAFAPTMAGICAERQPPCTAIFCSCMVFWEGSTPHRVVRALTTDADLLHGSHWIVAVQNA